jgi:hypothetical protein
MACKILIIPNEPGSVPTQLQRTLLSGTEAGNRTWIAVFKLRDKEMLQGSFPPHIKPELN